MKQEKRVKGNKWKEKSLVLPVLLLFFTFSLSTVQAQESVNATGGDASGSGGSASYSVGQVVYTTNTGTTGSVAQGVQQPYEIYVVTGIEAAKGINLTVSAYPNPTTDYLTLEVNAFELSTLNFQLYDMQGRLLQSDKITGTQTRISMGGLVPATYFVKVTEGKKEVKTFKIITDFTYTTFCLSAKSFIFLDICSN